MTPSRASLAHEVARTPRPRRQPDVADALALLSDAQVEAVSVDEVATVAVVELRDQLLLCF